MSIHLLCCACEKIAFLQFYVFIKTCGGNDMRQRKKLMYPREKTVYFIKGRSHTFEVTLKVPYFTKDRKSHFRTEFKSPIENMHRFV